MALHPILAFLERLLELCRKQASRSFVWLFKLFSFLTRRCKRPWPTSTPKRELKEEGSGLREVRVVGVTGTGGSSGVKTVVSSTLPLIERSVVLACASQPATPPRARTREHTRSFGSIQTLCDSPIRENSYEYCASPRVMSPLGSITEEDGKKEKVYLNTDLSAEPADMFDSPKEDKQRRREIKTIAPSERPRYDRNIAIKEIKRPWHFKPLDTYRIFRSLDVPGNNMGPWKHYVHPEGVPYYLYEQTLSGISFLTEADLRDKSILEEVEEFVYQIEDRIEHSRLSDIRPEKVEVVLEIQDGWSYYMVDPDRQIVFWLDDHSVDMGSTYGIDHEDHLRYNFSFEFWMHIEHFPNHRVFGQEGFNEAIGILSFWRIDVITSADSTAPYESQELDSLVKTINTLQGTIKPNIPNPYAVAALGRVMTIVGNERLLNFYGSPGARIQVWQSVRGAPRRERQWLVRYLSPLLFYAPETHLSGLEKQWVDGVIQERRWRKYQHKLERDWESFVLTSTVLLNANVALLTTPIVLARDNGELFASPAATASQVSIIASLASIIIGLLLIRQVRISAKDIDINAEDAIEYLSTRRHPQLGLETMAIHYSLPYALLMWGMVTFLTSIAIASFYRADGWPSTAAQLIYACSWLFIIPLILWTVLTCWETNHRTHWTDLFSRKKLLEFIRLQWDKSNTGKLWALPLRQRHVKDVEARDSDAETVANGAGPVAPINESTDETVDQPKNWRVRVRNFGPVRRLTLALMR